MASNSPPLSILATKKHIHRSNSQPTFELNQSIDLESNPINISNAYEDSPMMRKKFNEEEVRDDFIFNTFNFFRF